MIGDKVFFSGYLEQGEKLLFVAHRHFLSLLPDALKWFFLGLFFPFGLWFLWPQTLYFSLVFAAVFFLWFLIRAADWFFDAWLLTDRSVIDLEWRGIFHRLSSRISYADIDSISGEICGFWGTIFRFGNAKIGLASGNDLFLDGISRPKKVEFEIMRHRDAINTETHSEKIEKAHGILGEMIEYHLRNTR